MKIRWEWPKSSIAANLLFEDKMEREPIEKIESLIKGAGSDGHIVLAGYGISKNGDAIFMRKWNHFEWPEVCKVIETSIRQHFPEAVFENSKSD